MSDSDTPLGTFAGDSPEAAEIMGLVNMWRALFAKAQQLGGAGTAETLDPMSMSMAMTASAIMAGTFMGNAIVAQLMTDKDRRRATEMFVRNFRSGIDIGKRQGIRAAAEMPVGGHA